jgi:hypothetical protein
MRRTAVLLALVSTLAPACKGADNTKIVVAVWSDLAVQADLDSVRIEVAGTGSKTLPITAASPFGQATLVAKLELVPLGAKNETFTVTATGLRSGNEVVAQTASVSFVAGQSLLLKLFLAGTCKKMKCSGNYTCAAGACDRPIAVPNLPAYDTSGPLSPPDAGAGGNGGTGGRSGMSGSGGASGGVGGTIGSGGVLGTGGIVDTGGSQGPGGAGGSAGGRGGTVASGGVVATGGIVGMGGASGEVSGTIGSGGLVGTGGIVGSGGVGPGGAGGSAGGSGGTVASGGVVGTGGTGTGGSGGAAASGGGAASGGVVATGGIVGTGGVGTGGNTAACQESATQCSDDGLQTCANGQWGVAVACSTGLVCERCQPAACLDPTWAEWPMPNDQVDVTAGAPNLESYTDNKDGTVTDNITGLMWQQAVSSTTTYTWSQTVAYCPNLALAGHSDWRLPLRIELVSIVDFGVTSGATINAAYFPSTPASGFWSSSPLAGSSSYAWGVNFDYGDTSGGVSGSRYVRCVR